MTSVYMRLLYRLRPVFIVVIFVLLVTCVLVFIRNRSSLPVLFSQDPPDSRQADVILRDSWRWYARTFISEGRVVDPGQQITTSEGQAYALLRAVMIDDQKMFESVYTWTTTHLLLENGLYAWKWVDSDSGGQIADRGIAPDADEDIAIALLVACRRWDIPSYCADARTLIASLWEHIIVDVSGTPYFSAGDWADGSDSVVLNPSYFSPAYYRVFATVDPTHNWSGVVASSYSALRACTRFESGVLPPEWCELQKSDQNVRASTRGLSDLSYGYNALRVPWRIALDHEWFASSESRDYLATLTLLDSEWRNNSRLYTTYSHTGTVQDRYESATGYFGLYSYYHVLDSEEAATVYSSGLLSRYSLDGDRAYWDGADNYYTQNLAWFATALYSGMFKEMYLENRF
jgi:endoglucanase